MKRSHFVLSALILTNGIACAQIPQPPPENEPITVVRQVLPIYPRRLLDLGITEGFARIAISVDETGKLSDALAVAYSRPDFAESSIRALREWEFLPMRYHNEPVTGCSELTFRFEGSGVVVSLDAGSGVAAFFAQKINTESYEPCSFRNLDRIPTPVKWSTPHYPQEWHDRGVVGDAVVEFYIDESGRVRIPAVISADFDELGAAAVTAVADWEFEPPTHNNRAVLTRARQTFHFRMQSSR